MKTTFPEKIQEKLCVSGVRTGTITSFRSVIYTYVAFGLSTLCSNNEHSVLIFRFSHNILLAQFHRAIYLRLEWRWKTWNIHAQEPPHYRRGCLFFSQTT